MAQLRDWLAGLGPWELLVYSFLAAVVFQFVLARVILRVARRTRTDVDERIVAALRVPLFLTILLLGVALAARKWEIRRIDTVEAVLWTIAILFWTRALMRVSDAVLDALARRAEDFRWIQPSSLPLLEIASRLVLIGGAIYFLLEAWGLDVTTWLASAGILGIALGFAAKDTLANLFAGLFILMDAPYKLGDYIVLESGERGRVTDIGIRTTRILTRDDIEVTLPNAVIANGKITNEAGGPHVKRRVRVDVGVAYGSDVDRVRTILEEAVRSCDRIAQAPPPSVRFRALGDSALLWQVRGWIDQPVLHGRAVDQLNTAIYKHLNEAGIEIPFPQRVVHMARDT